MDQQAVNGMELSALEKVCPDCDGRRFWDRGRCQTCKGNGMVATELGQRIIDFIARHRLEILNADQ
jgi:DnaJ-class molecular chaperone